MPGRRVREARTAKRLTSAGMCALCGQRVTPADLPSHLAGCAPAHDAAHGTLQPLVHLQATAPESPAYWLDFEVNADGKLEAIDTFLRRVWLECCGHLSAFHIRGVQYFSRGYEFGLVGAFGGPSREERMTVRLRGVLPPSGGSFDYEYDFGSTTALRLLVTGERMGRLGRSSLRLLARNVAPSYTCATCDQPATLVCPFCLHERAGAHVCAAHRRQHGCDDDAFLPVVNSPRMGVCGYTGAG